MKRRSVLQSTRHQGTQGCSCCDGVAGDAHEAQLPKYLRGLNRWAGRFPPRRSPSTTRNQNRSCEIRMFRNAKCEILLSSGAKRMQLWGLVIFDMLLGDLVCKTPPGFRHPRSVPCTLNSKPGARWRGQKILESQILNIKIPETLLPAESEAKGLKLQKSRSLDPHPQTQRQMVAWGW